MVWFVVHYAEIATKGENRIRFEHALMDHIRLALGGLAEGEVRRDYGRIVVGCPDDLSPTEVLRILATVPGISQFAQARLVPLALAAMEEAAADLARSSAAASFRVRARRPNKRFPITSPDIATALGSRVVAETGKKVDLHHPELTISVEVTEREAIVYAGRNQGLGGLPVGMAGSVVCLLSGGIDSPVAAFKLIRRGARVVLLHFHNYSRYQDGVRKKLLDIAAVLNRYQLRTRLYIVPFAGIQEAIVAALRSDVRMVAYRRAMLQVGALVLEREKALAFVTGDSLGQVASQTLQNLRAIYDAAAAPVLAPLIAEDKESIIDVAKAIGTYEISIRPYDDCCSFLIANHPQTKVLLRALERREAAIPIVELAREAMAASEVHDFPPPTPALEPLTALPG